MAVDRIEIDDLIALRRDAAKVDLTGRRGVMTAHAGGQLSGFRGRGMEFEEHRTYQPGDEVRTIDWRVTARTGKPHVRVYREEHERPVLLAVDLRPCMWFGTRRVYKAVLAAQAAALCAWSAAASGERVGGLCFGGQGRRSEIRPSPGEHGALKFLHSLEKSAPAAATAGGEFGDALQRLVRTTLPGSLVALFSDFRETGARESDLLRRLARRAELIVGFVYDPLEADLPAAGLYPLAAAAPNRSLWLDTAGTEPRTRWRDAFRLRCAAAQALARDSGARWLELCTAVPVLEALAVNRRVRAA